ncbi:MAG: hypothetical protein ACK5SI_15515 [Planctomycetia bacterium]
MSRSTGSRGPGRAATIVAIGLVSLVGAARARAGASDHPSTLRVENVSVAARDATTATITFDVRWENSWRHEMNHDAAWVFFKVRPEGSTVWRHVRLAADKVQNPTGYGQAAGGTRLDLIVPDGADGFTGLFIRRADPGLGTVTGNRVAAVWDLASAPGITPATKVEIRGFGIDMVHVPAGPYELGGGTLPHHFHLFTNAPDHVQPFRVTGPGAIPTGQQPGRLWARRGGQPEDGGEIPATFPNGYAAIYCMKKCITSAQYAGFLNALPAARAESFWAPAMQVARTGTGADVTYKGTTDGGGHLNVNGLAWADGAAFAAWAGLRPMTELEYEKITRGPIVAGWDTGDTLDHPSFWGVTNMNGWRSPVERPVTVANATGRRFKGTHGLGEPDLPADWPQADAVGTGFRGGHGVSGNPSYRRRADTVEPDRGVNFWRGVRTAPRGVGL